MDEFQKLVLSGRIPDRGEIVLVARNYQPSTLVRLLPSPRTCNELEEVPAAPTKPPGFHNVRQPSWSSSSSSFESGIDTDQNLCDAKPSAVELLYLFACLMEWEKSGDPSAAWEVISALRSAQSDTRAHALALLERVEQMESKSAKQNRWLPEIDQNSDTEVEMRTPYGLEIIESCMGCKASCEGFFCRFSNKVLRSVDAVSHHSVMPSGAVLFVEGQSPRGVFVLCSGKVKLSTTSKDGKVLILKQAEAGEVLGLSAAISNTSYEMTAETASPSQVNYIGRHDLMNLLHTESEVGLHAAQWLSREFQGAYREVHDLVLARSSSGKLARLLLSCAPMGMTQSEELYLRMAMTHEEMAQRIGSSRETVTRLLSELNKKRLIRLEGAKWVIRDRTGLEALAV